MEESAPLLQSRSILTYDKETSRLRSVIPLDKLQNEVTSMINEKVTLVDFRLNGYCTDAVLWTLLQSIKTPLDNLTGVDLNGCALITDQGIKWLVDILKRSSNMTLTQVNVSGCSLLTDNALALLCEVSPEICTIDASGTNVRYLRNVSKRTVKTDACPLIDINEGKMMVYERGHVMVVPQPCIRTSVAAYIKSQSSVNREPVHHTKQCKMGKLDVALTEMTLDNPLFDVMIGKNPVQVIIPYDATAEVKDIKSHVMDTISRVVCKETVSPIWPEMSFEGGKVEVEVDYTPFMDVYASCNQIMVNNTLRNLGKGEVIGCYYSRQMMTRSHPYYEVKCESADSGSGEKVGILVGCIFDVICHKQDPMGTDVDVGGEVESFECDSGKTYGFGIDGEWESEYVPRHNKYTFYTTIDGKRFKGDLLNKNAQNLSTPFPLVAALGEGGTIKVSLTHMVEKPLEFVKKYENKEILRGFVSDCALDDDGVLSALTEQGGYFVSNNAVSRSNNVITFKLVKAGKGKLGQFCFGLAGYVTELKDWKSGADKTIIFNAESNLLSVDKVEKKGMLTGGISEGDTMTVTVNFISDTTTKVEFKHQPKSGSPEIFSSEFSPLMSDMDCRAHFVIGIWSKDAQLQIMNYQPHYRVPALIPKKLTVGKIHIMACMDDGLLTSRYLRKENGADEPAPVASSADLAEQKFEGCEFIIVGMAKDNVDVSGKAQLIQGQISLDTDFPALDNVTKHLDDVKRTFGDLDLQGQENFSRLCAVKENFEKLKKNKQRLHFLTSNLITDKGREDVMLRVETTYLCHQKQYPIQHQLTKDNLNTLLEVNKHLKKEKMQDVSAELFAATAICTDVFVGLLHVLQEKGDLLILKHGSRRIAVEMEFWFSVMSSVQKIAGMTMSGKCVTSVGSSCHVWTEEAFTKRFQELVGPDKFNTLVHLMQDYLGLVRLPCFRISPTDTKFVYTSLPNLATPPVALREFWSGGEKSNKGSILIQNTYSFLHRMPDHILALILSHMTRYGRTVLLTSEGGVFQLGAVQTVIVRHEGLMDKGVLSIESRCHFSDKLTETVNELTETTVKEYTWQVFCIYTDFIDLVLYHQNITPIISRSVPKGLVNVSVGCRHIWKAFDSKQLQSVCTLCNNCVEHGIQCPWNGIVGNNMRECGCKTSVTGCHDCGICGRCAKTIWRMRSVLRPNPIVSTKDDLPLVPMDPVAYNEIEITNLSGVPPRICLRDVNDGSFVRVFPGMATSVTEEDKEKLEKKLNKLDLQDTSPKHKYSNNVKDTIKLRFSDPMGAVHLVGGETSGGTEIQESRVVYHPTISRELRIQHETGIICYDTTSAAIPVGQFVGPRPFSSTFTEFSFKVMNLGVKGTIVIGICPKTYPANRQPGWNRFSIAYHGDDGGIFIESGYPKKTTGKSYAVGDIILCHLDVSERMLYFYKNGEEIYNTKVNIPRDGYFPCIGMHSLGECVKLCERDPWLPNEENPSIKPTAFDTHKYGNLLISPARVILLKKMGSRGNVGWIVLHNPTKDKIGYRITEDSASADRKYYVGLLDPGETKAFELKPNFPSVQHQIIKWIALEKSKTYSNEFLEEQFKADSDSIYTHRLQMKSLSSQTDLDVEELARVADEPVPKIKNKVCLEVYKNQTLVEKYWLNIGSYRLEFPSPDKVGQCLVKSPKCPSFLYPSALQKGMKVVVKAGSDLAEAVITELYEGGGYCLDYMPEGKNELETLCFEENTIGIRNSDWQDDAKVLLLKLDSDRVHLNKTFIPAPPFLSTSGSAKALLSLDPDWSINTLLKFSSCSQVLTRVTVQEQLLTFQSRTLEDWLEGYGYNSSIDSTFVYLPRQLDAGNLMFPHYDSIFDDVAVHRLCFSADQLRHFQPNHKLKLNVPIHFVDIPGFIPTEKIPGDLSYGCLFQGWIYIALLAQKLQLPTYKNLFQGDPSGLSRAEIESLLYRLLQPYASLCGIYASQVGGLTNQENPINGTEKVNALIKGQDTPYIQKFNNEPTSDAEKLVKNQRNYTCKAHNLSINGSESMFPKDMQLKYEYFEPYNELVNAFAWDLPELPSLPKDFFSKFSNLECLFLSLCKLSENPTIPSGIAKCTSLENVSLRSLGVSKLPADLLQGPALKSVTCSNMVVKEIKLDWPENSCLTKLILSGLVLSTLPSGISNLKSLRELILDNNVLTTLPDSLKDMPKLKVLSLKGIPWITFDGARSKITRHQYDSWIRENKSVSHVLGEKNVEDFFNKYDTNKNSELDEQEIAHLNLHLFFKIPRLKNTTGTEEFGGIPAVVFQLVNLQELYLNYQAITLVPKQLSQLQNLQILDLSHCPLLESIEGSVGLIPNIKSIRLTSCPSLRTPPNEVVSRGFESVRAYLKRLAGGFTECRRTKLMFVGLGGAGKTSLLQALTSVNKKTTGTQNAQLTDGIEIKPWTVKADGGLDITYSTWDFAGQTVYYNTHQFFLSNRAVYMLLWNMRMGFEHAGLDFWLSSIACHAPKTPIIVVGTQCDQVPKVDIPENDLRKRYPQITTFHYVSSIKGTGIAELEKQLITSTLSQKYMGEKIPQVWLNLEKKILAERVKHSILKWETVKGFAIDNGIFDDKDVKQAVKFLDDLGTLQYFDNDFLRDRVVINPQWIVNVMACVVSVKHSLIQEHNGRFLHDHIEEIWKAYDSELHNWLLRLTEEFDLTFPLPGNQRTNIVPCLLPQEEPKELSWPDLVQNSGIRENKLVYKFSYLPAGLFNRAQVRLFQFSDGKIIWKKGSMLNKNRHLALIRQENDSELVVLVQGPQPENILLLIHEVFESLIEESFHGVMYDFFIPCPDCISKEGTREPCLFKGELIRRAGDLKAPFLQCTKYFHTVSMGQLLEMMPEEQDSDFDIHLQHSISALQSLNRNMENDVAILYCKADLPKIDTSKVDPAKIRQHLEESGLSCWYPDMEAGTKMNDMMMALKNCKVLVGIMSDEFERDQNCSNMFQYAMEGLSKPFHIACVGESTDWQKTDLGMKIGQPRMAMIRTAERFDKKIPDLVDMVQETVQGINNNALEHPACFISYTWVNSLQAVKQGTKERPGSVGWGDPRDIKDFLEKKGIKCWIDHEQMSKDGLYHDIAVGLQNSRVLVACVSDEYVMSNACMMEIRFGVCTMNLPLIVVVVGTGQKWKQSEIGLLMRRSSTGVNKVYMQKENPEAWDTLLHYVKESIPKASDLKTDHAISKKDPKKKKNRRSEESHLSYKEEYELIQRKFMRHITNMISQLDLPLLPRLLVFDFLKVSSVKRTESHTDPDSNQRPTTSKRRTVTKEMSVIKMKPIVLDTEQEEWEEEEMCIRVLCEHEEGWHLLGEPLTLKTRTSEEVENCLAVAAPYLARIYAILRQSSMRLNCLNSKTGEKFGNWLDDKREAMEKETKSSVTFLQGYMTLVKFVADHEEVETFTEQLDRCHLPSGKISWLCKTHQKGNRITKLASGEGSKGGGGKNSMYREDILFKELLDNDPEYRKIVQEMNIKYSRSGTIQREKTIDNTDNNKKKEEDKNIKDKESKDKKSKDVKNDSSDSSSKNKGGGESTGPVSPSSSATSINTSRKLKAAGNAANLTKRASTKGRPDSRACSIQ
ncbi:uncharacterized protein LOC110458668 [Mizuhopecten yessoensis]|uniref:uncharacterized protein LOC110458668 n=1 Tax=Mizuhopecten yessoensis TaxID=6573 RepID=UPI000B45B840|nr:uncharacterized protein LOC110458668 [Mizuhopecten yessoensis]